MDAQVWAAIITSTVALVVAVVGIIATGRGQRQAATEAHRNALELFAAQTKDRERAWQAEAAERLRLAHLADRRTVYARLPTLLTRLGWAESQVTRAKSSMAEAADDDTVPTAVVTARADKVIEAQMARNDLLREVMAASETIRLVAPEALANAATAYVRAVTGGEDSAGLAEEYLRLARADLGVDEPVTAP